MAEKRRDKAICLYVTDFSETSQVAHFLTAESGVVHLLAKGSRRAKSATGGGLDLIGEGELVFIPPRGESLGTLVEFAESSNHSALRRRLDALNAAVYMLEITRLMLAEGDPFPQVFELLSAALRRLDKSDAPVQAVLAYYQWRILRAVGLLGEMDRCAVCSQPVLGRSGWFSSHEGGLLCQACEGAHAEKRQVSQAGLAGIAALRTMDRGHRVSLAENQARAVNDTLAYHISYQLDKPIRMLRHVMAKR